MRRNSIMQIKNKLVENGVTNIKGANYYLILDSNLAGELQQLMMEENMNSIIAEEDLTYQQYLDQINTEDINIILSQKKYMFILNRLLWDGKKVCGYLCLDTEDPFIIEENKTKLMNKKLWEVISNSAKNEIQGGGWVNSYTREYFTENEMDEFSQNVLDKVRFILGDNKDKKVFEIGCASGITMFKLLPYVAEYAAFFAFPISGLVAFFSFFSNTPS